MADQIFRREWDYLMNVFGEPTLGWYFPDYRDAVRNQYGEIIGGTVYLNRQCPMRGLILEKPVEFRQLKDGSGETQFIGIEQAVTFKVSATDLIKGGVLKGDGSYELYDKPSTSEIEGVLNHKYIIYRGQLYEVLNFDRGVIFKGDPSNAYITCTRDVDYTALHGKAQLVIEDIPDTPTPETYTVTVDGVLWGDYAPGTVVVLTTPSKEGYEFKGWASQSVDVVNNQFVMPSQTVVITAIWEKIDVPLPGETYLVYVDERLYGEYQAGQVVTLTPPTKEGYTFTGWQSEDVTFNENTFTMPSKDVSITSTWESVTVPSSKYTITVVNPCTSADATLSGVYEVEPYQNEDGSYDDPVLAIKAGSYYAMHNFSEWKVTSGTGYFGKSTTKDTLFYPTSENTTIEAVWTAIADPRHTVTFVGIDRTAEKYETGATVSCNAGLKEDYEFLKWTSVPSVTFRPRSTSSNVTFIMPDSDVVVTANWKAVEYTVTFMVNGEVFDTITTPPNTAITMNDPQIEGYTFNGWYNGDTLYDLSAGVTNDLTLTAKFTGVPRTITFDSDGGSAVESITVENGSVLGQLPTPTKEGYNFVKWTFNGEEVYPTTIVTSDMTLVADWSEEPVLDGEVAHIDLNSDYVADFLRQGLYFNSSNGTFLGDYSVASGGYNNRRIKQHFYLGDWGTELPPVEYTTTWGARKWPLAHEITTVLTTPPFSQQTVLNLYSKRAPGEEMYSANNPGWSGIAVTAAVMGVSPINEYTVPTAKALTPILLTVVALDDGWYRYEWGFVTGCNTSNNSNIGSITDKSATTYPLK